MFVLVSLSVMGLCVGASLVPLGRLRAAASSALDGLTLGMLPALVLARLLPHAFESLGLWSLGIAAFGFALPSLSRGRAHSELRWGSALVLPALCLHAVTDGAALAMSNSGRVGDSAGLLATAAILHRIPEGLFVASRQTTASLRGSLLAVSPLAASTVLGAFLGQRLFDVLPDAALDAVLALGAGTLLRLVGHSHAKSELQPRASHAIAGFTFACGVAAVLAIPDPHDVLTRAQPRELSIAASLLPLFVECAPALLLGFVAMALLHTWGGRREPHKRPGTSNALVQAVRGLTSGGLEPIDPAQASHAIERLLRQGSPIGWTLALAAASATLGCDAALLSLLLLGGPVTAARVLGSALLGLVGSLLGARLAPQRCGAERPQAGASEPRTAPFSRTFETGVYQQAAWIVLGLLLAAALEAGLAPGVLADVPAPWDILLSAAISLIGHIGALGATPIAAVLLHKGASAGAVLTFLWLAPIANLALFQSVRRELGLGSALGFVGGSALLALALAAGANQLLPIRSVPAVHRLIADAHSPLEIGSAVLVAGLLIASLLRLGPRALARSLSTLAHSHETHHGALAEQDGAHSHCVTR